MMRFKGEGERGRRAGGGGERACVLYVLMLRHGERLMFGLNSEFGVVIAVA